MIRQLVAGATLVGAAATAAIIAGTPRLVVAAKADSVGIDDTLYGVSATPYDGFGKKASSSRLKWSVSDTSVIRLVPDASNGFTARVVGLDAGVAWATASWNRKDGTKTTRYADSVRFRVFDHDTLAALVIVCLQTDSQYAAHPLPSSLDAGAYATARQYASCGPDSLPAKAP